MKRRVHTFGDSHALAGFEHINFNGAKDIDAYMNPHFIGSKLMYTFGQKYTEILNLGAYDIYPNDILIFCLGEIDCRCHIWKYRDNWQKIITDITTSYIYAIKESLKKSPTQEVIVAVYGIVPPIHKDTQQENAEFPFLGTDEERKSYVQFMNKQLKGLCAKNMLYFIDVYNEYMDPEGFLSAIKSDGRIHIGNKIPLINMINALLETTTRK